MTDLSEPAGAIAARAPEPSLGAWLAQACSCLPGTMSAIIVIAGKEPSSFELHSAWPTRPAATHLVPLSERCLGAGERVIEEDQGSIIIAAPLGERERPGGVVVFELATGSLPVHTVKAAAEAASRYLNQVLLGHRDAPEEPGHTLLLRQHELLQLICEAGPFPRATLDVVNWLAANFGCSRAALGIAVKGNIRLLALSHSAWFDRKSQAVHALEHAMEEALDQRSSVVIPAPEESAPMSAAHRALAQGRPACSIILASGDGLGFGVLYLERPAGAPFFTADIEALESIGQLIGPVLEAKDSAHRWIGGRLRIAQGKLAERLRDPRRPALRTALGAAAIALAGLTLVDVGWSINAAALVEGEQQRVIPAPFDGFIAAASVRAGAVVRKGQPLAELDTRQLRLDFRRWAAEEAQHDSRYRDALSRHDRPAAALAVAQMQQAQAQGALAADKLARATLIAPFDAYVVAGDLSRQIGSPVEQGKVLFELAPLDAYRVVLRVDERDIRAVQAGQRGRLMLAGLTREKLAFRVTAISLPEAIDGRNVFRVEARLDRAGQALRPGMQGIAKIEAGQRSLLWIWTHSAWDWLVLLAWKWWP